MLKFVLLSVALFSCCFCSTLYTRNYQFKVYDVVFAGGRDAGVDFYFWNWANSADVNYENFSELSTIRRTTTIQVSNCGSDDALRKIDYIYGDSNGSDVSLKTTSILTESEALNQSFNPAPEYENTSDYFIEYDVHPCGTNWVVDSTIYLTSSPDFSTCSDVYAYFPDAVDNSDSDVESNVEDYVEYVVVREGDYLDGSISLTLVITYPSLQDAIDDTNRGSGEFSYTFYGNPEITSDSAEENDTVQDDILSLVGSFNNYPCLSDPYISSGVESSNQSSSASTLLISSLLMLSLILL